MDLRTSNIGVTLFIEINKNQTNKFSEKPEHVGLLQRLFPNFYDHYFKE